jgi:hypothetical protein
VCRAEEKRRWGDTRRRRVSFEFATLSADFACDFEIWTSRRTFLHESVAVEGGGADEHDRVAVNPRAR